MLYVIYETLLGQRMNVDATIKNLDWVEIQIDLDLQKFDRMFVDVMKK